MTEHNTDSDYLESRPACVAAGVAVLPAFGGRCMFGRHVHQAVLDFGATTTGATVHYVDADYDTGAIIAQIEVPVAPHDTIDSLASRVQEAERVLLFHSLTHNSASAGQGEARVEAAGRHHEP